MSFIYPNIFQMNNQNAADTY